MKVKIINCHYEILDADLETLKKEAELEDDGFYYGAVHFPTQRIFLNNKLNIPVKDKTLRHELCHAMLFETGHSTENMTEEIVCDIMGAFSREINKIADEYFKSMLEEQIDGLNNISQED